MRPVLEVTHATMQFGGLVAVNDLNMSIGNNEIVALIGPNGAGKTTAFNMITGVYKPTSGIVSLNTHNITGLKPNKIAEMGIARTFQNIRLFKDLSVEDNVKIGLHNHTNYNMWEGIFRLPRYWKEEKAAHDEAMDLLKIFDMQDLAQHQAGSLPYGAQRRLEIVRALATHPKLLLLDEPAAGMNPTETHELMETIRVIRDKFGVTILLIEHDMKLVMGICERIYVLNYGSVIAEGTPDEIRNNPEVITAYLGKNNPVNEGVGGATC